MFGPLLGSRAEAFYSPRAAARSLLAVAQVLRRIHRDGFAAWTRRAARGKQCEDATDAGKTIGKWWFNGDLMGFSWNYPLGN